MDFAGKTVLVTGATGFLGNAIARRLATEGARVRALARTPHKADRLRDVPDVEIAIGDITDAARMRAVEAGCELVIHCAAALNGPPEVLRHANVTGTQHVAQAAAEAGVARLVHISSIAVYGFHRHGDITEDMGPAPHDIAYATTKTAAEQIAQETAARTGLPITIQIGRAHV
jgi:nucleoside-diphosphate-sugar epimerase